MTNKARNDFQNSPDCPSQEGYDMLMNPSGDFLQHSSVKAQWQSEAEHQLGVIVYQFNSF